MSHAPADLAAALEGRYRLERELGRGGMATVYLAEDIRHQRPVALKVLHPELAESLGPERFEREIHVAARLQHPHILTVLDSGEAAGRLWFTMPYVEGESLRDRLDRERQLPLEDAVRIADEAARALDYAHRHGVIHRDIKPENLLLTADGSTLVADFGIARALSDDRRLTQTGLAVGTPAYMSPEQAAGDAQIDPRTDIYSLGAVAYEMLAGEPPFSGGTAQSLIARRVLEDAPLLRTRRSSVPEGVERAVARALARVPADRFATAADFGRTLGEGAAATTAATRAPSAPSHRVPAALAFALGLLVTATAGGLVWRQTQDQPPAEASAAQVIAVIPFENVGSDSDEYFADGVTDAIRGKLASMPGVQVIARSSSAAYKQSGKSLSDIARELGAQYLLTGTVRWERSGGASQVQVSPELVRVRDDGAPVTAWGEPFSAATTDVFTVQADIAQQVSEALNLHLGERQHAALRERPTDNLAAYDAFLRGEEVFNQQGDPVSLGRAIAAYERAVALDTAFALGWAQLSRANAFRLGSGLIDNTTATRAMRAAERAIALAPDKPEGLIAMGDYHSYVTGDNALALEFYARARTIAPNNADALSGAALSETSLGRWPDALEHFRQAHRLDPRAVRTGERLSRTWLWLRRYPEALEVADRMLEVQPASVSGIQNKAMVRLAQGDLAGARAVLAAAPREVDPGTLAGYMATFWDLYWVLDEVQQQLLPRLDAAAFGGTAEGRALALAGMFMLQGDTARGRLYADSAQMGFASVLADRDDAEARALRGVALAYMGRHEEAIREGLAAVSMTPTSKDAFEGPYVQHQLVRIYIIAGEPELALDQLEPLLNNPYILSPGWLRIDPTFAPLRGNPRFEKLIGS